MFERDNPRIFGNTPRWKKRKLTQEEEFEDIAGEALGQDDHFAFIAGYTS
jgi:hypothetical protein